MELKSSAKLNIGLHVHNLRSDGFHNISTLFQEVNLFDSIKIDEAETFSCKTSCGNISEADNFGTKAFKIVKRLFAFITLVMSFACSTSKLTDHFRVFRIT